MEPPLFRKTSRFRILKRLGAGGMGVVYEAYDRERKALVALKTLVELGASEVLLFKNEFRALQDLDHPNLVGLGELLEEGGHWFFTMELVRGTDFLSYVRAHQDAAPPPRPVVSSQRPAATTVPVAAPPPPRPSVAASDDDTSPTVSLAPKEPLAAAPGEGAADEASEPAPVPGAPRFDEPRLRACLRQLFEGLAALHRAGKVHRDVKPSNILVTDEGRVVLLDFGVVLDLERGPSVESAVVGTPAYMAPEQLDATRAGPEADWYSAGVLLYEALTGRLPFPSTRQALAQKRTRDPLAPGELVGGVPADLEGLCLALLQRDPARRPGGIEVLQRLGVEHAEEPIISTGDLFFGRRDELTQLEVALDDVQRASAVTVLVHGESGLGKTSLVRRFVSQTSAQWPDAVVLQGRCFERESVPFKAVDEVVDALSRQLARLSADELAPLLPEHTEQLAEVFPSLRQVEAIAGLPAAAQVLEPQEKRTRLFAALRELLARVARHSLLVITIDDLQWADQDSLTLLFELLRPPGAPPLLMVGTVRTSTESRAGQLTIDGLRRALPIEVRELRLTPLPPKSAHELAAAVAARVSSYRAVDLEAIADEAGGHPLFIDALVRHRIEHGRGASPVRLEDALSARIARLDAPTRALLELLAVAGVPISQEAAARAAACNLEQLDRLASTLRAKHMVRSSGARRSDTVEAYHNRIREAACASLPPERRREWHGRLALALEQSQDADAEVLGGHWRDSGNGPRGAGYFVTAADQARDALAFERAARLYRQALELLPPAAPESHALKVHLGDALAHAGRGKDAAESYLAAVASASPGEALDLRRRAAEQYIRSGHIDVGLEVLGQVLAEVGMELAPTPTRALVSVLVRRAMVRLRGLRFHERDQSQAAPEELLRMDVCWAAASSLASVDTIRGADHNARLLLMALRVGEPHRLARALAFEATFASFGGRPALARTEKLLELSHALARKLDRPEDLVWPTLATGIARYFCGRFAEALRYLQEAEVLFRDRCAGAAWELGSVRQYLLITLWFLGRVGEIGERAPELVREAQVRGDLYAATNHRLSYANVAWLLGDDPGGARRVAEDAATAWSQHGFHAQHWWTMTAQAQLGLYEQRGRETHAYLLERWPALRRSTFLRVQNLRLEALGLRARGALAAAAEDRARRPELARAAARDARRMQREQMPWGDALAELVLAGVAASAGDRDEAVARLAEAARGADGADLALYAAVARRRLGELLGGDEGGALVRAADAWMTGEAIASPARFAHMLAPGF